MLSFTRHFVLSRQINIVLPLTSYRLHAPEVATRNQLLFASEEEHNAQEFEIDAMASIDIESTSSYSSSISVDGHLLLRQVCH